MLAHKLWGTIEKVFDIQSLQSVYFSFATEFSDAIAQFVSLQCIGLAQGAKASHNFLQSGVFPV